MTNSLAAVKDEQPGFGAERRRYDRLPSAQYVQAKFSFRSRWSRARLVDFSPNAVTLEVLPGQSLRPGQPISLRFPSVPGRSETNVLLVGRATEARGRNRFGIRFDTLVAEQIERRRARGWQVLAAVGAVLIAGLIALLKSRNVISYWYGPVIQTYSIGAAIYVISRVVISSFYREPKDNRHLPTVTLIVAVKNEEEHIAETVARCLASRYPKDKLEVFVVDDGSTDGTWAVLQGLTGKYDRRFRCFQFAKNRGKRHAMALGTRESKSDILIFIDSDTFLEEEAIYRLVQPFADPRIGAVAGHTNVIVEENNIISKMEAVRYFVSQRVMKAAESVFNSVTCCPGPLSAYRKAGVDPILDEWENQMFMGARATFGDDRSLTNYLLRRYRVIYHAGARCATYTPNKLSVFIRQQLRWKKSWLRELTVAGRFMWKKHPIAALSYYAQAVITLVSPLIAFGAIVGLPFLGMPFNFVGYIGGLLLAYMFLGLIFYYFTRSKVWPYGLLFALLYVCIFSFQNYYALLTIRENGWGTR